MKEWYRESFGEDYLLVYRHRNIEKADQEVGKMIKWLKLESGAKVLDLCCGMGRHALSLSRRGYEVTGMDLSATLLEEAARLDVDGQVRWVRGDMRDVPLEGPFQAVLNLFTSFGYFVEDEENVKVIREIKRLLQPGGSFIIDFLNPAYVKDNLVPHSVRMIEGERVEENRKIDNDFVRKTIQIGNDAHRIYHERVKLYELPDFEKMLQQNGLTLTHVYGDYDTGEYDSKHSPRLILVGKN